MIGPQYFFGNSLVVAQVALSLVLLSVSQLYIGHLSDLRNRDLGFDRTSVLLVSVDTSRSGQSREALLAAYVPARRATRVDPLIALRSE